MRGSLLVVAALVALASLPVGLGVVQPRAGVARPEACAAAERVQLVLTRPPLAEPFQRVCNTDEFARLVARWGADNLTVVESIQHAPDPNASHDATAARDAGTPVSAELRMTWVADGQVHAEWWSLDLRNGAVDGPFATSAPTGNAPLSRALVR